MYVPLKQMACFSDHRLCIFLVYLTSNNCSGIHFYSEVSHNRFIAVVLLVEEPRFFITAHKAHRLVFVLCNLLKGFSSK